MPSLQTIFQPMMRVRGIKADADAQRFTIKATGGGFLANLLGLGTKASLTVDENGFRLHKTTFSADEKTYIPRAQIASTVHVVMKPVELLILGLVTLPLFGFGIILIIVYFLSRRRVIIGVISTGGTAESVKLKASDDELEEIRDGMAILEELIRGRAEEEESDSADRRPLAPIAEVRHAKPMPVSNPGLPHVIPCPSCGTRMSIPPGAAGRKVRCGSCREVFPVPSE